MKSVMDYDTAMSDRHKRILFLDMLKYLRSSTINICEWSLLRSIKNTSERCDVLYTEYISDICKSLIVSGTGRVSIQFNIINDNIEYLHISLYCWSDTQTYLNSIIGKNIRNITLIYVDMVNPDVFVNIRKNCPKLEKLTYTTYNRNENINEIVRNIQNIHKNIKTNVSLRNRY